MVMDGVGQVAAKDQPVQPEGGDYYIYYYLLLFIIIQGVFLTGAPQFQYQKENCQPANQRYCSCKSWY